jgi:hypothetical protein
MGRAGRDYQAIRGSGALATAPLAATAEVARAEALEPGELRRIPFQGELLGAVRVRARYAALPLDAFDRAAGVLGAEEQGAYFQLLRLAYGEGRNFCRAGKRDLALRLGLSERRLHRVLDALCAKRFLRPLHRDNRGTLWRVYLPREAFGEPLGDDVLLGRAAGAELAAVVPLAKRTAAPPEALARALAGAQGGDVESAAEELAALAADGATPRQLEAYVAAAARRAQAEPPPARGAAT